MNDLNAPNVPNGPNDPNDLRSAVARVFSAEGALARGVTGYEERQGQRQMAEAVASVIEDGGMLLAEAGTGTGKTLAYLIPGILSRQRVLVSTGTKNLQEQIYFKDLPALQQTLGVPFTATLMKGRSNYLCRHRWEIYRDGVNGQLIDTRDVVLLPIINEWASKTETGDRAELRDLPEDLPIWKEIAADVDTCLGSECPRYGDCFITLMRQRAAESDVVIVNHHLLCADASVRKGAYGEVIPSCPTLVVDEAHQLEDTATQYFGVAFSNYRIDDFVRDVHQFLTSAGRPFTGRQLNELLLALTRVSDRAQTFFANIKATETRARYRAEDLADRLDDGLMLIGALEGLEASLAGSLQASEELDSLQRRAGEMRTDLRFLLKASDADYVYYAEARGRGIFLRASPIDVSRIIRDALFDRMRATVLTSATLAVDDSFDYIKGRLGLRDTNEIRVRSEFDYTTQALLYLPRRVPPPNAPSFGQAAARETIEILKRSKGRAFVLFTSYAVLRTVQQYVEMALPYPVFVQGTAPRSTLIEQFRATPNAVLLATSSFWQGVDVVGDALSCVIIDKLPFVSPGDPVTAARIDAINATGGNAFADYQVPLAILSLQQGLGRLIRHRTDRGVLAVLDPRLKTMGYGRRFLDSLPPAPVTHDLDAVARFFE